MIVGDLTELSSWVLGWGKTASVVEPQILVTAMRTELSQALARYGPEASVAERRARPNGGKAKAEQRPGRAESKARSLRRGT
jgi:hypothetical protein